MVSIREGSKRTELHETQPFYGRRILITGGATGTGFEAAKLFHGLGADIVIGTRSQTNFEKALEQLGTERTYPFIADITDYLQIRQAVESLRRQNLVPTDIIFSAAGGMESFMRDFIGALVAVKHAKTPQEKDDLLGEFQQQADGWAASTREASMKVNYEGPVLLIEVLSPSLPRGTKLVDYSSLWSSYLRNVPRFYRSIAESKHEFENWLMQYGPLLAEEEIYTAIISGHVVTDSGVGKITKRYVLPLLPIENQEVVRRSFITTADMMKATRQVLESNPSARAKHPKRLFVANGGQITESLSPQDPIFSYKLPI